MTSYDEPSRRWNEFFHQWGKLLLVLTILGIVAIGLMNQRFGFTLAYIGLWAIPAIVIGMVAARSFDRPVSLKWPVIFVLIVSGLIIGLSAIRIAKTPASYEHHVFTHLDETKSIEVPIEEKTFRFATSGELHKNETTGEFRLLVSRGPTRDLIIDSISTRVQETPAMGGAMTKKQVTKHSKSEHLLILDGLGPLVIQLKKFPETIRSLKLTISAPRINWMRSVYLVILIVLGIGIQAYLSSKGQYSPLGVLSCSTAAYSLALKTWNFETPLMYFIGACLLGGIGGLCGWVLGGFVSRMVRKPAELAKED